MWCAMRCVFITHRMHRMRQYMVAAKDIALSGVIYDYDGINVFNGFHKMPWVAQGFDSRAARFKCSQKPYRVFDAYILLLLVWLLVRVIRVFLVVLCCARVSRNVVGG